MGSRGHDAAMVHDDDHVTAKDGREPVGDGDHGAASGELLQSVLDHLLRLGVEGRGRLVEQEDRSGLEQGAGDGETLLLAAGEEASLVPDHGLVAVGLGHDEIVGVGEACRLLDFGLRGVETAEADVLVDRVVEEKALLRHDADLLAQREKGQVAQVSAVDQDSALLRVVEAEQEGKERALSRAAGADQRDLHSRLDDETDPGDGITAFLAVGAGGAVGEVHPLEGEVPTRGLKRHGSREIVDGGLRVEQLESAGRRTEAVLQHDMDAAEVLDRVVEQEHAHEQRDEAADGEMRVVDVHERQGDAAGGDALHHRLDDGGALLDLHAGAELLVARLVKEPELEGLPRERLDDADAGEGLLEDHRHHPGLVLHGTRGLADAATVDDNRQQEEGE